MTRDHAFQLAMGYAWGVQDTRGKVNTLSSEQFAVMFANGWDDYNTGLRGSMVPVRDAYAFWKDSLGKTIFPEGDSTEQQIARHKAERAMQRTRERNSFHYVRLNTPYF
jgi:hypothetical protein